MSVTKSPFILGTMHQDFTKTAKNASGQKSDDTVFMDMVHQSPEVTSQNEQSPHVISRLFANGLAMGESQHQQNEMIMQNFFQSNNKGIPLEKNPSGLPIQPLGKGIPIDAKRDIIFSSHNIALNRKVHKDTQQLTVGERVGQLAAQFESGSHGITAIGYDAIGGTSYGKYQIASKPGSMQQFITFLEKNAPDIAEKLKGAGPADTGSRSGKMPEVWQDIAKSQPKRFEELQEQFIAESHYKPAMHGIQDAGFNTETFSLAMKEVVWSTAVQHGPSAAVQIFTQAADKAEVSADSNVDVGMEQELIQNIYDVRKTRFGSSTDEVRLAIHNRMNSEKDMAIAMLHSNKRIA